MRTKILAMFLFAATAYAQKPQPSPEPQPPRRAATLAQQKMCSDQAEKFFRKEKELDDSAKMIHISTLHDYRSHYDAKTNICFMLIHRFVDDGVYNIQKFTVYDAFENAEKAEFEEWLQDGRSRTSCSVRPVTAVTEERKILICGKSDEFFDLVKKQFGLAWYQ